MKDAEALTTADVNALQHWVIGHVVVDIDAGLLRDDLAVLVKDVKDAGRAAGNKDALVLGVNDKRSVAIDARDGPGSDELFRIEVKDAYFPLVADIGVEAMMNAIDADAFDVVAGNGEVSDEFALVGGEDGDLGVWQVGGDTAVADVETVSCIVEGGVGRVALAGGGAVDQGNAIEAVEVLGRYEDEGGVAAISDEQFILFGNEGERVRGLKAGDALQMLAGAEIEHLDGVVDFGGNEEMVTLQIDGEVIEVPGNVWQNSHVHESDGLEWRLISSEGGVAARASEPRRRAETNRREDFMKSDRPFNRVYAVGSLNSILCIEA